MVSDQRAGGDAIQCSPTAAPSICIDIFPQAIDGPSATCSPLRLARRLMTKGDRGSRGNSPAPRTAYHPRTPATPGTGHRPPATGWAMAFEQSDLSQRGPRGRAMVWIAVCVFFALFMLIGAFTSRRWLLLLPAFLFGLQGARTLRRLRVVAYGSNRSQPLTASSPASRRRSAAGAGVNQADVEDVFEKSLGVGGQQASRCTCAGVDGPSRACSRPRPPSAPTWVRTGHLSLRRFLGQALLR